MTYPSTPELDKLREKLELNEFSQRLGGALDDGPLVLAEWVPDSCSRCGGEGKIYKMRADEFVTCPRCKETGSDPDHKRLAHRSPSNKNLAALFNLDYDKMEDERTAVLDHIRGETIERSP